MASRKIAQSEESLLFTNSKSGSKKKPECKFFKSGKCFRGEKCTFAHTASTPSKNSTSSITKEKSKSKCFYCSKSGHYAKDCRKKQKDESENAKESSSSNKNESKSENDAIYTALERPSSSRWVIDSGSTRHICNNKQLFSTLSKCDMAIIEVANKQFIQGRQSGTISLRVNAGNSIQDIEIRDVLYIPNIAKNLLSVKMLAIQGLNTLFTRDNCVITSSDNNTVFAQGISPDRLYYLEVIEGEHASLADSTPKHKASLWHQRLGHISLQAMNSLKDNQMLEGLNYTNSYSDKDTKTFCEPCVLGKSPRKPFPKISTTKTKGILELIHSDVVGPLPQTTSGNRYLITFIDDYTRKIFGYLMKKKSDALNCFKDFHLKVTVEKESKIKTLRSDNGGEYMSKEFSQYLAQNGIKSQFTTPHSPQQNGVAERFNRTIIDTMRVLIKQSNLPDTFWGEAVMTAIYLRNRSPTAAVANMVPEHAWSGTKPNVMHLRVFGCDAYAHNNEQQKKLHAKSQKCTFLGYDLHRKCYRLFDFSTGQLVLNRDVTFNESAMFKRSNTQLQTISVPLSSFEDSFFDEPEDVNEYKRPEAVKDKDQLIEDQPVEDQLIEDQPIEDYVEAEAEENNINKNINQEEEIIIDDNKEEQEEYDDHEVHEHNFIEEQKYGPRSSRIRNPTTKLLEHFECNYAMLASGEEPLTYKEAITSENKQEWIEACKQEYDALVLNNTWKATTLPLNRKAIGNKWVFKIKEKADGTIDRYKARLVAKGFSQVKGIDFNETFAPVAKYKSTRCLLAVAAHYDLDLHQMDFTTAFLNGTLDEEIYMEQPDGFQIKGKEHMVLKLQKGLYGLKQASRTWNLLLDNYLKGLGYVQCVSDECIYVKKGGSKAIIIIAVYVDDLIIASNSVKERVHLQNQLSQQYQMKDMGELHWCLGMRITRDRTARTIKVDQSAYIMKVLKRFTMEQCKSCDTPAQINVKLTTKMSPSTDTETKLMKKIPYQSAIGSLMYAMIGTRPDIAAATIAASRFMSNPGTQHWTAVKKIFRYLRGTTSLGITFSGSTNNNKDVNNNNNNINVIGYCDSDWGDNIDHRKSTTGYVFHIANGPVSWSSKVQPTVALSSTEAEYMAVSMAAQDAKWIINLLNELHFEVKTPVVIYEDNQGCIALSKNNVNHSRTKHIDIKHHFIRECVKLQQIQLQYLPTEEMVADMLTKPIDTKKFVNLRATLMG